MILSPPRTADQRTAHQEYFLNVVLLHAVQHARGHVITPRGPVTPRTRHAHNPARSLSPGAHTPSQHMSIVIEQSFGISLSFSLSLSVSQQHKPAMSLRLLLPAPICAGARGHWLRLHSAGAVLAKVLTEQHEVAPVLLLDLGKAGQGGALTGLLRAAPRWVEERSTAQGG